MFRKGTPLAIPAPQPAYVFVMMAPFHAVPYYWLRWCWAILEILAFATTARLIVRLTDVSAWIIWPALGISDLYCSLILGQFSAFCVLGIAATAWGYSRRSQAAFACGLLLTSLEPHIAAPCYLAFLLWGRRERGITIGIAMLLLGVSLIATSPALLYEYAFNVLPLHARSEILNQDQLSATYALHALGVSASTALTLANIQYCATIVIGILVARAAEKRYGPPMLAFAPPAFAVLGGPFLHITQLCVAIPAAVFLYAERGARRYALALWFLCIPWLNFATILTVLPLATACWAAILRYAWGASARLTWGVAGVATVIEGALAFHIAMENVTKRPDYGRISAQDFAERTWQVVIEQQQHSHTVAAMLAKVPSQLGLSVVLGGLVASVAWTRRHRGRRYVSAVASGAA